MNKFVLITAAILLGSIHTQVAQAVGYPEAKPPHGGFTDQPEDQMADMPMHEEEMK